MTIQKYDPELVGQLANCDQEGLATILDLLERVEKGEIDKNLLSNLLCKSEDELSIIESLAQA